MSGMVIKLNDDDEEEDDVAELLARIDTDDDDDNRGSGSHTKHRRRFYATSRRLNPVIKSGTLAQLLNTICLCCVFFGLVIL